MFTIIIPLAIFPEWAPNIHPIVVHFPIALLVVALLLDLIRIVKREHTGLNLAVQILYGLGTLGLIVSFITGRQATETVEVAGQAFSVLASHENWAFATMIFFIVFFGLRFAVYWFQLDMRKSISFVSVLLGLIGLELVAITGDRGGELVFGHGVGVTAIQELQRELDEKNDRLAELEGATGPQIGEDGSWTWRIVPGAEIRIFEDVTWLSGNPDAVLVQRNEEDNRHDLSLTLTDDQEIILLVEHIIGATEGRIQMLSDNFHGQISLIHNVESPQHYQYLRLNNADARLEQGQILSGEDNILGSGTINNPQGWIEIRVQASDGHFYGHINGDQVVHTHTSQMEPGYTGLKLKGEGTFRFRQISFEAL
ncbi:MAG TPA: DUF2231 domain-containing protein [Balneolaceae bacterium]|nr:DUF2231 domain-containing protein [Balneolaceae bacterium]